MDLFEDMREMLGCEYISDLRFLKRRIMGMMKMGVHLKYSKQQREDFCQYIFRGSYQEDGAAKKRPGNVS